MAPILKPEVLEQLLIFQQNELTEYHIYQRLARRVKEEHNQQLLQRIATDELRHHNLYQKYTQQKVKPRRWQIFKYYWIARLFGLTFGLKLMERGEERAHQAYQRLNTEAEIPELKQIAAEEEEHEHQLLNLITEERLNYVSSIVLGLNDALVELTGTLAGLTFALQNTKLIALTGLITGVAASFSMGASEYLSTKAEGNDSDESLKSALYTWAAYILTVICLILPYLLAGDYFLALTLTLLVAVLIIMVFNFYLAVAKDLSFQKRFLEMTAISLGVAALSFFIGYLIRTFMGIEI
ncbi:MAG: rubrerythrin family protein [Firmicutes bacterium]|nr:rubrerythrin family protein [Bacillota bacterium]